MQLLGAREASLRRRQANSKLSLQNRLSDSGPALGSLRLSQGVTADILAELSRQTPGISERKAASRHVFIAARSVARRPIKIDPAVEWAAETCRRRCSSFFSVLLVREKNRIDGEL
jgi:hypothetical protein